MDQEKGYFCCMDIAGLLRQNEFFKEFSKRNLVLLAEICIPKTVKKRETLFIEGQEGNFMFFLVRGNIQVFKTSPEGREIVIKVIKPGEIFAEVILFEEKHYPASAVALKESHVLLISKRQMSCLLVNESFRNEFICILMKKQRYLADRIYYLTVHDVEDRFFHFLEEQYGIKNEYKMTLSKKDIAAAIGTTPESLSRLLLRLKNEKKLSWEGKLVHLSEGFWEHRECYNPPR
ncbi:MAG: Crp/Fnr family transcriptional regulator [Spirochaetota bacterium]